jgi:hypothetical protein
MRRTWISQLPAVELTAALVLTALLPGGALRATTLRFTSDGAGAVIVPVRIGGEGPFPFLLDTGSNGSIVSARLARRLAAPVVARAEVLTPAGRDLRPVVALEGVSVADRQVPRLLATVAPNASLAQAGIEGILGQDFLHGFDYALDYRRGIVELLDGDPEEEDGDAVRLSLEPQEGRFLVRLPQDDLAPGHGQGSPPPGWEGQEGRSPGGERLALDAGASLRLVPDSGSDGLVLFVRPGRSLPLTLVALPLQGQLAGTTGARTSRRVLVPRLRVGEITLRRLTGAAVERPEADAPDVDGLLPLHGFARVTFHARAGYMTVRR